MLFRSHESHREAEADVALDAMHDVVGRRIGQKEGNDDAGDEGRVHHAPGADTVRQPAPEGAKRAARHGKGRSEQSGHTAIEPVNAHVVTRQPRTEEQPSELHSLMPTTY